MIEEIICSVSLTTTSCCVFLGTQLYQTGYIVVYNTSITVIVIGLKFLLHSDNHDRHCSLVKSFCYLNVWIHEIRIKLTRHYYSNMSHDRMRGRPSPFCTTSFTRCIFSISSWCVVETDSNVSGWSCFLGGSTFGTFLVFLHRLADSCDSLSIDCCFLFDVAGCKGRVESVAGVTVEGCGALLVQTTGSISTASEATLPTLRFKDSGVTLRSV